MANRAGGWGGGGRVPIQSIYYLMHTVVLCNDRREKTRRDVTDGSARITTTRDEGSENGEKTLRTFVADEQVRRLHVEVYQASRVHVPQRLPDVLHDLPDRGLGNLFPRRQLLSFGGDPGR